MRKRLKALAALTAVMAALFSAEIMMAAPIEAECQMKQISVYRKSMTETETVECAFFSDLPEIPYIPVERFYETFLDGKMTVEKQGSTYIYTEQTHGTKAFADAESDSFTAEDLADFISTPVFKMKDKGMVMSGPDRIVKINDVSYSAPSQPTSIDFSDYSIDLREVDGVLYFPFATVSDLFSNADVITAYYDQDKIYYVAMYEEINGGNARTDRIDHVSFLNSKSRSAALSEFNYHEICFAVDTFYGFPCSYSDFSDYLAAHGLDEAIGQFDPDTKTLLLSQNNSEYLAGLYRLFGILLGDAGHTGVDLSDVFNNPNYVKNIDNSFWYESHINQEGDGYYQRKLRQMQETIQTLVQLRYDTLGSAGYYSEGDTAMICFDSFYVDYEQWKTYFDGTGDMPQDTVGQIYQAITRAKSDTNIKNFVFDLTQNGGGDTVALQAVIGMVTGKKDYHFYNTLGKQYLTETFVSDRNLDGVIDKLDDALNYGDLRFGVLTSGFSFSCANIMASEMKDSGFPLIGEQSGGGTCAVALKATADGLTYHISTYLQYVNRDLQKMDDGVAADISLVRESASARERYADFYDLSAISAAMNRYYQEQKDEDSKTVSTISDSSIASESSTDKTSKVFLSSAIQHSAQPSAVESRIGNSSSLLSFFPAAEHRSSNVSGMSVWLWIVFGVASAGTIAAAVVAVTRK